MVESDLMAIFNVSNFPSENRQVSRRVTTMLCCWIRMLLSWRSCCGVKLRQLELVRSFWNLAKQSCSWITCFGKSTLHFGNGQKWMEIIAQVKFEFSWCFSNGLECFFFVSHFCGWHLFIQIHPDHPGLLRQSEWRSFHHWIFHVAHGRLPCSRPLADRSLEILEWWPWPCLVVNSPKINLPQISELLYII